MEKYNIDDIYDYYFSEKCENLMKKMNIDYGYSFFNNKPFNLVFKHDKVFHVEWDDMILVGTGKTIDAHYLGNRFEKKHD